MGLRPCLEPRCPTLVKAGRCAQHQQRHEQQRGSAASRGYDYRWQLFIPRFKGMLLELDIVPACGAALPGGPAPTYSRCRAEGRLEMESLHLDHTPPLQPDERANTQAVCDPLRVIFYCSRCHRAKTAIELPGGTFKGPGHRPSRPIPALIS